MKRLFILGLLLTPWLAAASTGLAAQDYRSVSLCEIASAPMSFDERRVRIEAAVSVGLENKFLFDPACMEGAPLGYYRLSPTGVGEIDSYLDITDSAGHAWVVFEGVVKGPVPVAIDSEWPDWLKRAFEGRRVGYGYAGAFEFMIEVENIVSVRVFDAP